MFGACFRQARAIAASGGGQGARAGLGGSDGIGTKCSVPCAAGTCTCQLGASRAFGCTKEPCSVACDGMGTSCTGTLAAANGVCSSWASCQLTCQKAPCQVQCQSGAACTLDRGNLTASQCSIALCSMGTAAKCPDGKTWACDAVCPAP